jgi:hypothetical protein
VITVIEQLACPIKRFIFGVKIFRPRQPFAVPCAGRNTRYERRACRSTDMTAGLGVVSLGRAHEEELTLSGRVVAKACAERHGSENDRGHCTQTKWGARFGTGRACTRANGDTIANCLSQMIAQCALAPKIQGSSNTICSVP